jgi:hypothetical protein
MTIIKTSKNNGGLAPLRVNGLYSQYQYNRKTDGGIDKFDKKISGMVLTKRMKSIK